MSTSILYHAYNLKGVHYKATTYEGNSLVFAAEMTGEHIKCPKCKKREFIYKGSKTRRFNMSPIGRKRCFLDLERHRCRCNQCGTIWWPHLPFMIGKHRYTRSFALTVLDLLKSMTILAAAEYLGVGWDLVKEIHKSKLKALYRQIPLKKVKHIGIDEFSIQKNHKYMTVVSDLKSGRILHAVEGKSKDAIKPFLKKLARKAYKLEAVAMDMSGSYYSAVSETLPHVEIVFDHYHVAALMNRAIDDLRRQLQNEYEKTDQHTLKGSRFLLLKNYVSLDQDKKQRLDALLRVNQPLFLIHSMKEQLRLFWQQDNKKDALGFLDIWISDAVKSTIPALAKVGRTLSGYRTGLLNYYKHFITSGSVEGLNNKIKTLKRQAYGFRDKEYFKLRLYHLHTQRYSLTG